MSSGFDRLGANVPGRNLDDVVTFATVRGLKKARGMPDVPPEPELPKPVPDISVTLLESERAPAMTREQAAASGYTGDHCANCQGMRVKVDGHCSVCEDCGTTTGCS